MHQGVSIEAGACGRELEAVLRHQLGFPCLCQRGKTVSDLSPCFAAAADALARQAV